METLMLNQRGHKAIMSQVSILFEKGATTNKSRLYEEISYMVSE